MIRTSEAPVCVTHDQPEAMTTADLIAVMNVGTIDQPGTPQEIHESPPSEFVARFVGASNVIRATARDRNHIAFAGETLEVLGAQLTSGQAAVVAIRQHVNRIPVFGGNAGARLRDQSIAVHRLMLREAHLAIRQIDPIWQRTAASSAALNEE